MNTKSYFFCGIGGSGMLPLANIVAAHGASVSGSDRALDQGRSEAKFDWLRAQGVQLFAQDGSGLVSGEQILIASAAIEDSVPDIARANALGCTRMTRAELLSTLFNAAPAPIGIAGTSGKSTVTGMTGWILADCGLDPTIMNGAVMKNFAGDNAPFASARTGKGQHFVSEVDESDGSIALYQPDIAVITNISLDHKTLEELRALFGDFAAKARALVWNHDDAESRALFGAAKHADAISFGFDDGADFQAVNVTEQPLGAAFTLNAMGDSHQVTLQVPGRHNIANALAAMAAAHHAGVPIADATAAMARFTGLARRFDIVGTSASGISVIDDFGHNPEKIAATLRTLKAFPGRVIAFFQPHGFGPLRVMGTELAQMFADELGADDKVLLCDPVYFGGTVDRSIGSADIVAAINTHKSAPATHIAERTDCGKWLNQHAQKGDRIVIMGARDDTLSGFARGVLDGLQHG
jgi:UDP-N-acetylmuramate--alanine ligase